MAGKLLQIRVASSISLADIKEKREGGKKSPPVGARARVQDSVIYELIQI